MEDLRFCDGPVRVSSNSHGIVSLRLVGDEAVFLDQVAGELGESIPLTVTMKDRPKGAPELGIAVRGWPAHPVRHAEVRHAAHDQAPQTGVRMIGGGGKDR